jgi:hypothetical protein
MTTERGLSIPEARFIELPDETKLVRELAAIKRFQDLVHTNLEVDQDYGVIPGTGKKATLLKPGAEKIIKLLGLCDEYVIVRQIEDWDKPLFSYLIKCQLRTPSGLLVSEGLGECNSMESKYRWREQNKVCPICGAEAIGKSKEEYGGGYFCSGKKGGCGRSFKEGTDEAIMIADQPTGKVQNDDIYSQINTLVKMAKKRAQVDAALSVGRLSNIFTQDLDDLAEKNPPKEETKNPPDKPQVKAETDGKAKETPLPPAGDLISEAQFKLIARLGKELGLTPEQKKDLMAKYGNKKIEAFTKKEASDLITELKAIGHSVPQEGTQN